ncbi:MAG: ABC transporter ATP-binding protein [Eubacteriales bacterium]
MQKIAILMEGITKKFGNLKASDSVNLELQYGEVHALLGENGAGKSTLMNMLSGIYIPDEGSISIFGKEVNFTSPKDSIAMGIGMIHQHFKLIETLTAAENVIIGQKGSLFLNKKKIREQIEDVLRKYNLDIALDKKVYDMSVGEKQTLEIVKVLCRGANILILDEPTAVLTPSEIDKLFAIIRNLKAAGTSIIIITHKLNEVMEISDRITVLRKGKTIGTVETSTAETSTLIEMMVGKKVELALKRENAELGSELLRMSNVTILDREKKEAISSVSFSLRGGEILGVAGVAGSGQKELCEGICGLMNIQSGKIEFENEDITGKSPKEIIKLGISMGFIPEDRLGMGLVGSMDIVSNIMLKDYQNYPGFMLKKKPCIEKANKILQDLDIQTSSIFAPVRKMSGGNIQKVLLGREIDLNPKVLITAYPVRGLDIGASYRIYDLLNEQKKRGVGVLFIGEDLDVLLEVCDRIIVMCAGKVSGIVDATSITKEDLGLLMTGTLLEKEEVGFNELA